MRGHPNGRLDARAADRGADLWEELLAFRSAGVVRLLAERLAASVQGPMKVMQVCGTHTWSFLRHGLPRLVPPELAVIAGPGCPVCVTDQTDIDWILDLCREDGVVLATFGDLMRVPGNRGSLLDLKDRGRDVRVIVSPTDVLDIALAEPGRRVVLVAIGFETTAPTVAATVLSASRLGLGNLSVILLLKRLVVALPVLLTGVSVDGLLCPGHVAAVVGAQAFEPLVRRLSLPCVVGGFEPVDILAALLEIAVRRQDAPSSPPRLVNAYPRAVTWAGNAYAQALVSSVFDEDGAAWRGLGHIPGTGYALREPFARFAVRRVCKQVRRVGGRVGRTADGVARVGDEVGCICDQVILGRAGPSECPLFGSACTPDSPIGPCMVSHEGTCAAYYHCREDDSG